MNHKEFSSRGGKARAKKMTKKQRSESASQAATKRWQQTNGRDYTENVSRNNFFPRVEESKVAFSGISEKSIWYNGRMKKTKSFDGRFNIYQIGERGFGYNPCMRQWEIYDMDEDGSIQDLRDRVESRTQAEEWAKENVCV